MNDTRVFVSTSVVELANKPKNFIESFTLVIAYLKFTLP
jgi:hypothetical protein